MAKNTLKTLARNLKKNAVKLPNSIGKLNKALYPHGGKGYCGCHSELPEDVDWTAIPRGGMFDKVKGDRGNNRALMASMAMIAKKA